MRLRIDGGGSPTRTGVMTEGQGRVFSGAWPWDVVSSAVDCTDGQELARPKPWGEGGPEYQSGCSREIGALGDMRVCVCNTYTCMHL